jgi:DNA-binding response OmpR family regulator
MADKILYVEDDDTLAFLTNDSLQEEGYDVCHCTNGHEALKKFKTETYDICIIDVMLPVMDGFTLAKKIREFNSQVPIIFVTAKSMKEDKIMGLTIGADDYITKPFSIEELLLKINIFLKRRFINDGDKMTYKIGKYTFDFKNLTLTDESSEIHLTQREGELLEQLIKHKNDIVSRKVLLERVWGKEDYFLGRSMDVFISRLRKLMSGDVNIKIENIHGVGFRISDSSLSQAE